MCTNHGPVHDAVARRASPLDYALFVRGTFSWFITAVCGSPGDSGNEGEALGWVRSMRPTWRAGSSMKLHSFSLTLTLYSGQMFLSLIAVLAQSFNSGLQISCKVQNLEASFECEKRGKKDQTSSVLSRNIWLVYYNPNTFAGLVGKVRKKLSGRRKEGRVEKKAHAARPPDPGLEPGTCRVLGEGPPLHATGAI